MSRSSPNLSGSATPTKKPAASMAHKMLMPRSNRQFEKIKQQLTQKTREKKKRLQNENDTPRFEM
jgi:hypothetical protein